MFRDSLHHRCCHYTIDALTNNESNNKFLKLINFRPARTSRVHNNGSRLETQSTLIVNISQSHINSLWSPESSRTRSSQSDFKPFSIQTKAHAICLQVRSICVKVFDRTGQSKSSIKPTRQRLYLFEPARQSQP